VPSVNGTNTNPRATRSGKAREPLATVVRNVRHFLSRSVTGTSSLSCSLSETKKHGNIDSPVFVPWLEAKAVCVVKQVAVENDSPVCFVPYLDCRAF